MLIPVSSPSLCKLYWKSKCSEFSERLDPGFDFFLSCSQNNTLLMYFAFLSAFICAGCVIIHLQSADTDRSVPIPIDQFAKTYQRLRFVSFVLLVYKNRKK